MIYKIIGVIVVLFFLFVWKVCFDKKSIHARMKLLMEQEWGMPTRDDYDDKIMKHIQYYHSQKDTAFSIDDITWNDLDMDKIYMGMNHTRTSVGEEYLYHVLRSPEYKTEELEKREALIQSYLQQESMRSELEIALGEIGKTDRISVYEYLCKMNHLTAIEKGKHILSCLAMIAVIAGLFVSTSIMILCVFLVMGVNAYLYYQEKAKLVDDIALFQFILATVRECDTISKLELDGCETYLERLGKLTGKFHKFSRFYFLVSGGNSMTGTMFDSVFDYVRILFHVDLIKLSTMTKEVYKYQEELLEIYEIIGFLDSMLAVASYRTMLGEYAIPEFVQGENVQKIHIENMYHPLISNPVTNTVSTDKCMLLTGSNASGKSTFIKTVAINALFAQTIHTVLGTSYRACFYRIYSSMALRDDILSNESYFIVEIKSLKRIFKATDQSPIPVLCFIDEILRGTNTVERVAASSQLLQELAGKNVMCFAATHDIELTYLLEDTYHNYHFQELLSEGDISFDYLLKEGRANSRNAIRLLELIGFSKDTVEQAKKRVDLFLEQGVWQ